MVVIRHCQPSARGQKVAGLDGRMYEVNPATGNLHLIVSEGTVSDDAGCDPSDAARFLNSSVFRRVGSSRPPPRPKVDPPDLPKPQSLPKADSGSGGFPILDNGVSSLRKALASGDLDDDLAALAVAESEGKNRKSALTAITERIKYLEA